MDNKNNSTYSVDLASGSGSEKKEGLRKHLVFSLDDKRYAIPLSLIKEVIGICDITPVPRVPDFYKGMINLRGQVISVIDLRTKLNIKPKEVDVKKTSIIISHVGEVLIGCIVDDVLEVVAYNDAQINCTEAERYERSGDGIYGVAKEKEGGLTLLIDIKKALEKTDFKVLQQQVA